MNSIFLKIFAAAGIAAMAGGTAFAQAEQPDAGYWDAPAAENEEPADSGEWAPVSSDPADQSVEAAAPVAADELPADATDSHAEARAHAAVDAIPSDDVFSAAEGVFGRGAAGLADLLQGILRDQGEPVAYITGQEAGGAFIFGVRYGSGVLHHQVEGDRPVHWTGPSLGFDFGADATKIFVLVYNLHDTQRLFTRFPAAEGNAYVVGGFTASYMRRGDVVLIPVRMGVGLRLGVNAGYMRFSERTRWLPF